jgi:hypothetical protein
MLLHYYFVAMYIGVIRLYVLIYFFHIQKNGTKIFDADTADEEEWKKYQAEVKTDGVH